MILIDDPLKPEEALSDTQRQKTNDWYDNTLYSRLNDKRHGAIVVVMQRLHEDDLVGHVLAQEGWEVVRFPAIAEEDEVHEIETIWGPRRFTRRRGEVLHAEREPLATLEMLRRTLGEYHFAGQYLQSPAPLGGGRGLRRIGLHKTRVAVWQVHRKEVDLALDPGDLRQSLAKIDLRMAWIVPQRHKHVAMPQPSRQHVVLNDGDPADIAVLVTKPFEDPLRGMALLSRPTFIRHQDLVDDPGKPIQFRTRRRPAPSVPGRHRKRQHLRHRSRVDPITPRRFPPAHTFNLNRKPNLSIQLHALHPPAPAAFRQRPSAAGFLLRRHRTTRPLH